MRTAFALLLFVAIIFGADNPVPNPAAVVSWSNARFTVLTPQLIRMEYSASSQWNDRPSLAFVNRFLSKPPFTSQVVQGKLTITTDYLVLTYHGGEFTSASLQITLRSSGTVWAPGANNAGNLYGTYRTLDQIHQATSMNCSQLDPSLICTMGLISTNGWALVDDSGTPIMNNNSPWPWFVARPSGVAYDWYFFGHGRNYRQALAEFIQVAGRIPMPPRYIFGIFFSKYWAYSDHESMEIVRQYETYTTPLDTWVTDMDWHITLYKEAAAGQRDQAGQFPGWTGYTWDSHLWRNPQTFLSWCKRKGYGLRNTLNLHPASGVQPYEALYPEMARAMGIDPATQKYVPFDITNQTFSYNLWKIMLSPLEKIGVDFWWLDWQQEDNTSLAGLNPTFALNYYFFTNPYRWVNEERPVLYHRWGGLGNHRYQIGFSGDVWGNWNTLAFEVYFTLTAANVGYSYWSHDIGGHQIQPPPELYTRWVQFGVFSPVFRPHCTKQANNDRRIWTYPMDDFLVMRRYIHLRSALVAYIYNASRTVYDTGVSLVYPLYYDYPDTPEAYSQDTYMFGSSFFIAPILTPLANATQLAERSFWLPPGGWIDFFQGQLLLGPKNVTAYYALDETPAFVSAGSIIPMLAPQPLIRPLFGAAQAPIAQWVLAVFPTTQITEFWTYLYDDAGDTQGYMGDQFTTTRASYTISSDRTQLSFVIDPITGSYPNMLITRQYQLKFHNVWPLASLQINGKTWPFAPFDEDGAGFLRTPSWDYDGDHLALSVYTGLQDVTSRLTVEIKFLQPLNDALLLNGIAGLISRAATVKAQLDTFFPAIFEEDYEDVVDLASTGARLTALPTNATAEITAFSALRQSGLSQIAALKLSQSASTIALATLKLQY